MSAMSADADRSATVDEIRRAVAALKEAALALGEVLDRTEVELAADRDVDDLISEIMGIEVRQDEEADHA